MFGRYEKDSTLGKSLVRSLKDEKRRSKEKLGYNRPKRLIRVRDGVQVDLGEDDDDDDEERIHVVVRDFKPHFLRGEQISGESLKVVYPVKDPTSDMAKLASKGSPTVRHLREQKERVQSVSHLRVAGSNLGNIMGLQRDDGDDPDNFENEMMTLSEDVKEHKPEDVEEEELKIKPLPIHAVKLELMQLVRENQVVVIVGETGSGKTTQITQFLLEMGYGNSGIIACTQPRRVAATSVARRVAEEQGCKLGDLVGYAVRFDDCTTSKTRIKYMTDGILVRESLHDSSLEKYSCVMLDEAHERGLQTDILMGLLRRLISISRRDLKVIIASATLDASKFATFFGNVPVFSIPGRTFPVEVMFSRSPAEDYVDAAVKQVLTIHMSSSPGDILVFLTGQEDIETTCELITSRIKQLKVEKPLYVYPIYSQLPQELQGRVFQRICKNARKVVVATNIAETSLTIDGIVYVIDCGFCKLKVYNPKVGMDVLTAFPISQANANQRSGRAGRTQPGTCYRLYTESSYKKELLKSSVPEIQRTNLSNVVLLLKNLSIDSVSDFDFMDMPPRSNVMNSMHQLWTLGALNGNGELTALGRRMAEFPLEPSLSKMLLCATEFGCALEVITIVAMLSVPNVFYRPKERAEDADSAREKFFVPESDHLTLLHVYNQYRVNGFKDSWCVDHFLLPKSLRRAQKVREQLLEIMKALKLVVESCGTDWDCVRQCVCSAYFRNGSRIKALGEYVNLRTGTPCYVHPTSALFGLGYTADYVVYHELVMTSKPFMQYATAVEPQWLAELGPMFFAIRGSESASMPESFLSDCDLKRPSDLAQAELKTESVVLGKLKKRKHSLNKQANRDLPARMYRASHLSFEP